MTDILVALGKSQLRKLDSFIASRRKIVEVYEQGIDKTQFKALERDDQASSSCHLFVILVQDLETKIPVFDGLKARGIVANVHYRPI